MERYVGCSGQFMAGPDLKYTCAEEDFRPFQLNDTSLDIIIANSLNIEELYRSNRFPNALGSRFNPQRPVSIAAVAKPDGETVAVATGMADYDEMWQIGVDTLPGYRQKGLGKGLVSILTQEISDRGILPYYSTWPANIASRRLAASLGYRPAWIEMYSRDKVINKVNNSGE
jgi:predicted GNAT family acetyltransferase